MASNTDVIMGKAGERANRVVIGEDERTPRGEDERPSHYDF